MICPRRFEHPHSIEIPEEDNWRVLPNGDRVCSYCGSLHPDDMLVFCRDAMDPSNPKWVEMTDKMYKFYLHPMENASKSAIKFYLMHAPTDSKDDKRMDPVFLDTLSKAISVSQVKMDKELELFKQRLNDLH